MFKRAEHNRAAEHGSDRSEYIKLRSSSVRGGGDKDEDFSPGRCHEGDENVGGRNCVVGGRVRRSLN